MGQVQKHVERLIVRRLDDELSAEEEVELDRELMRSPQARRLLDEYRRVDAAAAQALGGVLADRGPRFDETDARTGRVWQRNKGRVRAWWLIPGAIAAAWLALSVPSPFSWRDRRAPSIVELQSRRPDERGSELRTVGTPELMRNVGNGLFPESIKRSTGRNVLGVIGNDGNVYLIEVERVRTLRKPNTPAAAARDMNGVM